MKDEIVIINTDRIECPKSDMDYDAVRNTIYNAPECKKVSIVVLAYGRAEKTRQCVEHILKFTRDIPFSLILLDNGSVEADVIDYFKNVDYSDKTIVRSTKNIGNVYSLDKALQMANTKYVAVVNNDVLVTPRWLDNLLKCAESDSKIGMVCPVSTNVSCGQEVDLGGFDTIDEMIEKAEKYNISNPAKWEERLRMIPTVGLYRRDMFDIAGLYDVGFIHDWGDDDYTFRVRHAGYKLMLCRDTFVHHNHNVRGLEEKDPTEAKKLARSGRAIFRQRHHGIDSWDDTNDTIAAVLSGIDTNKNVGTAIESLSIDCKCGAMVLDAKNFYRQKGIYNVHTTALVNDIRYYHELQCVADQVIWGTLDEMERVPVYDLIAIGKPVNQYANPMKILEKAYKMLTEDGFILFSLVNSADYRQFLYCLGVNELREKEMPRILHQEEIMNWMVRMGGEIQNIFRMYHSISDDMKETIEEVVRHAAQERIGGNSDDLISNLLVKRYWFIVKKPVLSVTDKGIGEQDDSF